MLLRNNMYSKVYAVEHYQALLSRQRSIANIRCKVLQTQYAIQSAMHIHEHMRERSGEDASEA